MNKTEYIYIKESEEFLLVDELNENKEVPLKFLPSSNKVNLFVGANNSRKSRFMREVLKQEVFNCSSIEVKYYRQLLLFVNAEITKVLNSVSGNVSNSILKWNKTDFILEMKDNPSEYFDLELFSSLKLAESFQITSELYKHIGVIAEGMNTMEVIITSVSDAVFNYFGIVKLLLVYLEKEPNLDKSLYIIGRNAAELESLKTLLKKIKPNLNKLSELSSVLCLLHYKRISPEIVYVPLPRGAIKLNGSHESIYVETVKNLHFTGDSQIESKKTNFLHTGQDIYEKIAEDYTSESREVRQRKKDFETFISNQFQYGSDFEIIPISTNQNKDKVLKIFIKGVEREIHNLGDGVQALITLLHPIFMAMNNSWIFIEEPEINLHPGFQSLFINTLLENEILAKKNLKYFITTHSNHLLNTSIDKNEGVSIYTFKPNDDNTKSIVKQVYGHDMEVLDLLGVNNSSVFMANSSVWVEGVSDRRYLKAFLKAYLRDVIKKEELIEGYHYAFFEYAGSNIAHYLFGKLDEEEDLEKEKIEAHLISNKIFLLADFDEKKEAKHSELSKKSEGYFKYMTTEYREIENVLPPALINSFCKDELGTTKDFTAKHSTYEQEPLGTFIISKKITERKLTKGNAKTLSTDYKNKLSTYILKQVEKGDVKWADLEVSKPIKEITKGLYEFILKCNGMKEKGIHE